MIATSASASNPRCRFHKPAPGLCWRGVVTRLKIHGVADKPDKFFQSCKVLCDCVSSAPESENIRHERHAVALFENFLLAI